MSPTPGPWKVSDLNGGALRVEWDRGAVSIGIADMLGYAGNKVVAADARLIAAAPDLLAFVKAFLSASETGSPNDIPRLYDMALSVAAKAEAK